METTGWRIYKRKHNKDEFRWELISWIDMRCKQCGRFIEKTSRTQRELCSKCRKKRQYKRQNKWRSLHKKS